LPPRTTDGSRAPAAGTIQAEKLRHATGEVTAALARPGRYATVAGNRRVKEVNPRPGDSVLDDRSIVCHNPEQSTRDAAVREQLVAQLDKLIARSDRLSVLSCAGGSRPCPA
jgi:hypothetical protein